jgi:hypothetical protein
MKIRGTCYFVMFSYEIPWSSKLPYEWYFETSRYELRSHWWKSLFSRRSVSSMKRKAEAENCCGKI